MSGLFKSQQEKFEIVIFNYSSRIIRSGQFYKLSFHKVIDLKNFDNEIEILRLFIAKS